MSSSAAQRLIEVGDQILRVLQAAGIADQILADTGGLQLLGIHLPVRRRCRMQAAGVRIGYMRFDGRDLEPAHDSLGCGPSALDAEAYDAAGAVRQVFLSEFIIFVARQAAVLHPGDLFMLLKELGRCNKPILLKRGLSATMEEFLMAAEYIFAGGNKQVILCERGIRTFEKMIRNNLDLSAVPLVKMFSHLPIIIDPSHAAGRRDMVQPLSRAAIAAGADGLIIEAHNDPKHALCDGAQSLDLDQFDHVMSDIKRRAEFEGRVMMP